MAELQSSVFIALDVLSLILAGTVAAFFWRTHRVLPESGYGVPAVAFAILAGSYLTVAVTEFRTDNPFVEAIRNGGQLLGAVLLFASYAARRARLPLRNLTIVAWSAIAVTGLYLALYFVIPPRYGLPDPGSYQHLVKFAEFTLFVAIAYLTAADVKVERLTDLQVPTAYLLFALSKYTWTILGAFGVPEAIVLPYVWRLLGLLILLGVIIPTRRFLRAAP